MAKVRKRTLPSGEVRWLADYRDGAGNRRSKQFKLKKDADLFLVQARGDVLTGVHVPDSASITVEKAAEFWIERARAEGLEQSTVDAYRQHVNIHIVPLIGARKLSSLKTPDIEAFKDELLRTRSRAMAKRVVTSLSGIFKEAMRRGNAVSNPVQAVSVRRDKRAETRPDMPTKAELKQILAGAKGRWKPLIWTAVFTGMRASELRGLTWSSVNFEKRLITVSQRADLRNQIGRPKSKSGNRDIRFGDSLSKVLRDWKKECPKGSLNLVFPNGAGNVEFHQNILKRGYNPLLLELGIASDTGKKDADGNPLLEPKYGFHALRHAAASLFIEQGLKPKRVQAIMGHSSIQVTFDTYGYLFQDDDADARAMAAISHALIDAT